MNLVFSKVYYCFIDLLECNRKKVSLYILCVCHDHFHHDIDQIKKMKRWLCFLFFFEHKQLSRHNVVVRRNPDSYFQYKTHFLGDKQQILIKLVSNTLRLRGSSVGNGKVIEEKTKPSCLYICFLIARSHLSVSNTSCS